VIQRVNECECSRRASSVSRMQRSLRAHSPTKLYAYRMYIKDVVLRDGTVLAFFSLSEFEESPSDHNTRPTGDYSCDFPSIGFWPALFQQPFLSRRDALVKRRRRLFAISVRRSVNAFRSANRPPSTNRTQHKLTASKYSSTQFLRRNATRAQNAMSQKLIRVREISRLSTAKTSRQGMR
jgi:hypothetical protein